MALPGVAVLTLFLIPFIDRGPMVRLGKRGFAIAFVLLAAIAWTGLTTAAVITTPKNRNPSMRPADTEGRGITAGLRRLAKALSPRNWRDSASSRRRLLGLPSWPGQDWRRPGPGQDAKPTTARPSG